MISIINYGIGNLGSVLNMFKKIGVEAQLVETAEQIEKAKKLVLPGVGAFDSCMEALERSNMLEAIQKRVLNDKIPLLGICVGYQMLTRSSEEGTKKGLGWLNADTVKFRDETKQHKIPHMGWNYLNASNEHLLVSSLPLVNPKPKAYFVHSYYVKADNNSDVILSTNYIQDFASGMAKENIMGVQFHPEKSHKYGMQLFKSFAEIKL